MIARGSVEGIGAAALCQVLLAACAAAVPLTVSLPPGQSSWHWLADRHGTTAAVETEAELAERLARPAAGERLRAWEPVSPVVRSAANRAGIAVIDAPVLAHGRLELRWYLREQTVSRVVHRYGHVAPSPAPLASPG